MRRKRTNKMLSNMTMTIDHDHGHDSEVKLENLDDDDVPFLSISNSNTAPCFFCLQDSGKRSFSDLFKKPEIVSNQISLRHLTRFLKVFEDNDNEEGGKMLMSEDLKRKLYKFAYDSAVFICPDCSKMMKEFMELYHLMEVTELRLNWCVQQMHHVMTKIKTETKSKSSSCKEEGNDNLLLETLRTMTIDRMSSKSSLPPGARVILPKTELPKASSTLPPAALLTVTTRSKSHSRALMTISNENNVSVGRGCEKVFKSEAPTTSRAVCPPSSSPGKVPQISKQEPCAVSDALSSVKSSQSPSTSSSVKSSIVEKHESVSQLTDQATSSSASQLAREDIPGKHSYLTRSSSSNKRKSSSACPCCPDLNTSIEKSAPLLSTKSASESTTTTEDHEAMCNSASADQPIATIISAPTPLRKKHCGKYLKCSLCRAQFPTQTSGGLVYGRRLLRRHTLTYHCEQFFPIQDHKIDSVSVEQYKKILSQLLFKDFISGKESCSFCGNTFMTYLRKRAEHISLVKSHLVEFHFPQLKEILMQIQRDPDLSKILDECNPNGKLCPCGVYLANQDNQTRHKKLHCTLIHHQEANLVPSKSQTSNKSINFKIQRTKRLVGSHWKPSLSRGQHYLQKGKIGATKNCSYCRFKSGHSSVFTMHRVSFHPEHFFSDVWKEASGVTKDQFQRIIHNILFPELLPKTGDPLSCHFCEIRCNDKPKLKRHLVRSHENELKKRLREIVQHPNSLEELGYFNTQRQGMSCACGMYIPSWSKASQEYHEMYHCNLKAPKVNEYSSDDGELERRRRDNSEILEQGPTATGSEHGESIHPLLSSCPYCRYHCNASHSSASMARHLLRLHPQYYFPHVNYQLLGVTPYQFQRVLHDILFPELTSISPEGLSSCGLCGEPFSGKDSYAIDTMLRRHFINPHKSEVTNRLNVILNDPNLEEKLNGANPNGVLCPCGVYLPSVNSSSESYHEKFHCKLKLPERKNISYEITTVRKEMEGKHEIKIRLKRQRQGMQEASGTTVNCSYCLAKFSCNPRQKWRQAEYLRQHLLRYHCHHYFPSHKLDHVEDSQFHKILAELLFKDLVEEGKSCIFCDKSFTIPSNSEMRRLNLLRNKMHLIKDHFKELEERLMKIQKDPNLSKRLSECDSANGQMCRFRCGVYLSNVFSRATHEKLHCTKAASASKRKFTAANTSEDIPTRKRCRKQVLSLRTQAPSPSFSLTATGATTTTETTTFGGNGDNAKLEDENEIITFPKSCPYCRYACDDDQAKNSMARHLFRYHPQYYFPKLDYEAMGVSQDQFQRVLHDIIFSELVPVVGDTMLCRFCGKKFQEKDHTASNLKLRRHLVRIHGKELEDQIRVILRDPNLDERLARANLGGMSCPCGMYLPQGLGHKDNHHEKFQCNILTPKKEEDPFIGGMEVDVDDVGPEVDNDSSIDVKYNVTVGVLENVQVPGLSEELDLSDEDEYGFNEHAHLGTYQEENKEEFLDDESDPLKLE